MLATYQTTNYSPLLILKAKAELELRKRRKERDAQLEVKRKVWRARPELYAFERLNIDLTSAQGDILYSVRDNRRTAVKAHHSLGKTFVAAIAELWWVDCWLAHIGYITAPTWTQALGLTFKQAKRLAMLNNLEYHFDILESGLIRDKDRFKQTERFVKALNAENGEGFQGEHTAPILIIIEEAVGVPNYIFDASEGLMTHPDCRILEIANPTDEATKFGEHCESPAYEVFSFSALEHPNILAELKCLPVPYEKAIRLQWLYEMLDTECDEVDSNGADCFEFYALEEIKKALHGEPVTENSRKCFYKPTAFFQGRVLGEFPTEASNKVIPSGWLKNLTEIEINPAHKIQIGCDVAEFGDDRTTIFARIGAVVLAGKELRKFDGKEVASQCREMAIEIAKTFNIEAKRIPINMDVTGGLGTSPHGFLKDWGYNVIRINSSESANDTELYKNKRSELWFETQGRVKEKRLDLSRLPQDVRKKLIKELSTPTYKTRSGKKVVEEKSEIKKRLGASPDLADGFNLCFYETRGRKIYKSGNYSQASY